MIFTGRDGYACAAACCEKRAHAITAGSTARSRRATKRMFMESSFFATNHTFARALPSLDGIERPCLNLLHEQRRSDPRRDPRRRPRASERGRFRVADHRLAREPRRIVEERPVRAFRLA